MEASTVRDLYGETILQLSARSSLELNNVTFSGITGSAFLISAIYENSLRIEDSTFSNIESSVLF